MRRFWWIAKIPAICCVGPSLVPTGYHHRFRNILSNVRSISKVSRDVDS